MQKILFVKFSEDRKGMIFLKFNCEKTKLVEALSNVQKAVSQKSTIAALEGILISANDKGFVELCGYNTELGITTTLPATVKTEGKIVLNARLFTEIVRKMPNDLVEISVSDKLTSKITGGSSVFELIGIDAAEFPSLPKIENAKCLELPVSDLKNMIRQTVFAVSEVDTNPIHTGTLFEIKNKAITLVSVDGYRLALRSEPIDKDLELAFVVPGKTLREVLHLLPDSDETVKISAGMRHIGFYVGDYSVVSRLLEGEFIDYKSTVPQKSKYKISVNTQEFIDSIERVSLLITDRLKSPVRCLLSKSNIHISCITGIGKADDEIPIKSNVDEEFEIAFNNKYMADALKNTDCDEIELHLNGPLNPIKIVPKNSNSFLFLVLPVRIKAE